MRSPAVPPSTKAIYERGGAERLLALLAHSRPVDATGRYLHWDQLRFRPSPGDLTHEEWWAATRLARTALAQEIPVGDLHDRSFSFCEPSTLKAALRDLDMNAGGLLGADPKSLTTGEAKTHLTSSLAEEPFSSSLIEGAATTRQVAKTLIFEGRAPQTIDELMVLNNFRAMEFVKQNRDAPLTLPLLLELHRIVTQGTLSDDADAGRIRTTDEVRVVDESTEEPLFQPPQARRLPKRLESLFAFANAPNEPETWIHPLLRAMMLHFLLAYEHPFVDGNGRVARALFYWSALRAGYWLFEYVSISTVIARSKIDYGRAFLYVETDASDMTYFLVDQGGTLQAAVKSLHDYVDQRRREVRDLEGRLAGWGRRDSLNPRQSALLNEMIRGRETRTTIAEHESKYKVSYLTARSDLEALHGKGYLTRSTQGRRHTYWPAGDLQSRVG